MVRLTDRPDMTLDVYRGRKTTIQQQQSVPQKEFYFYLLEASESLSLFFLIYYYFFFFQKSLESHFHNHCNMNFHLLNFSGLPTAKFTVTLIFNNTYRYHVSCNHTISNVQSTLVISTSVISNNRLSRRKNLVLDITQTSKIRL